MAVILKRTSTSGAYTPFECDQPEYFRRTPYYENFIAGRGLNHPGYDHIISATQEKRTSSRVPDIITVRTIRVCSQRFKDFVEQWEPDIHFFEPFALKRKNGEDLGPHYKYGIGQDIDCLFTGALTEHFYSDVTHDGKTRFNFNSRQAIVNAWICEKRPEKYDYPLIEISAQAVAGAHLWTMAPLCKGSCDEPMVMSDAMYKAYRKEKFQQLDYMCKAHEIDRPWIAEENMGPMLEDWRERERHIALHWPKDPPRHGRGV